MDKFFDVVGAALIPLSITGYLFWAAGMYLVAAFISLALIAALVIEVGAIAYYGAKCIRLIAAAYRREHGSK